MFLLKSVRCKFNSTICRYSEPSDMSDGIVIRIFITPESEGEMNAVDSVAAVSGRGLIGDRYYSLAGNFSKHEIEPDQEITLIESEAFEELQALHGIQLEYAQSRRNIVTRGVDLNRLVGQSFRVGCVTLVGMRLCEPCTYLSSLTGYPKLVKQWRSRAGLRAHIRQSGTVTVGDRIISEAENIEDEGN